MASSGFGPYHGQWHVDAPTKWIGAIPTLWVMTIVAFNNQQRKEAEMEWNGGEDGGGRRDDTASGGNDGNGDNDDSDGDSDSGNATT